MSGSASTAISSTSSWNRNQQRNNMLFIDLIGSASYHLEIQRQYIIGQWALLEVQCIPEAQKSMQDLYDSGFSSRNFITWIQYSYCFSWLILIICTVYSSVLYSFKQIMVSLFVLSIPIIYILLNKSINRNVFIGEGSEKTQASGNHTLIHFSP